jgi:hypothetical protein
VLDTTRYSGVAAVIAVAAPVLSKLHGLCVTSSTFFHVLASRSFASPGSHISNPSSGYVRPALQLPPLMTILTVDKWIRDAILVAGNCATSVAAGLLCRFFISCPRDRPFAAHVASLFLTDRCRPEPGFRDRIMFTAMPFRINTCKIFL